MSKISDLLSTCYLLRQQTASQITAQLHQLSQHTSMQMAAIRQQERTSSAAQQIILDQLRPHLAIDARALLATAEFAAFVQELQSGQTQTTLNFQIKPHPQDWLLPTLAISLQLHAIETRVCKGAIDPCAHETHLRVQVKNWQQAITFPAIFYNEDSPDAPTALRKQWLTLCDRLEAIASQLTNTASQQPVLQQELFCLLSFVSELFTLRELANAVHSQALTAEWLT